MPEERTALPRPHRRGLIEGRHHPLNLTTVRLHLFRGLTAAASLKRQAVRPGNRADRSAATKAALGG